MSHWLSFQACGDAKSKPAFLSDKSLESCIKHIIRKFPNIDSKSVSMVLFGIYFNQVYRISLPYSRDWLLLRMERWNVIHSEKCDTHICSLQNVRIEYCLLGSNIWFLLFAASSPYQCTNRHNEVPLPLLLHICRPSRPEGSHIGTSHCYGCTWDAGVSWYCMFILLH